MHSYGYKEFDDDLSPERAAEWKARSLNDIIEAATQAVEAGFPYILLVDMGNSTQVTGHCSLQDRIEMGIRLAEASVKDAEAAKKEEDQA